MYKSDDWHESDIFFGIGVIAYWIIVAIISGKSTTPSKVWLYGSIIFSVILLSIVLYSVVAILIHKRYVMKLNVLYQQNPELAIKKAFKPTTSGKGCANLLFFPVVFPAHFILIPRLYFNDYARQVERCPCHNDYLSKKYQCPIITKKFSYDSQFPDIYLCCRECPKKNDIKKYYNIY